MDMQQKLEDLKNTLEQSLSQAGEDVQERLSDLRDRINNMDTGDGKNV
ncbi:MAG: hypothetical protein TR69_WS6001001158 [candidate division WS6 bacterium OLB20]|uniref:Uncharacterized protein n=1 Tax=candidate division WS6 bacterium OLB20 TaxID=1617426 RepID=A0A136LWY7_9BACT|nr:MAG: hypothetical protein TR69_WS6001001158 [candidate division WS6 bacterium OLB20]